MARTFRYAIITPEVAVMDQEAEFLVVPAVTGELGILPDHAPLIARLGTGEMRVQRGGQWTRYWVHDGYVQVRRNQVNVLVQRALPANMIPLEEVRRILADVEREHPRTLEGQTGRSHQLHYIKSQIRVAERGED